MLGTPPGVNEKFQWTYSLQLDLTEQLERESKRYEKNGQYETLQVKKQLMLSLSTDF